MKKIGRNLGKRKGFKLLTRLEHSVSMPHFETQWESPSPDRVCEFLPHWVGGRLIGDLALGKEKA